MTYRTLLVHLDGDARCAARVGFALQLAKQFDAHLVGLAAIGELKLPVAVDVNLQAWQAVSGAVRDEQRARAERWLDLFRTQAESAGHRDCEGLLVEGDAEAAVVSHGRWSDLLVLSQFDEQDSGNSVRPDFPQRVFMAVGRPVLLVPRSRSVKTIGTRALVGWSGTRESVRALTDSLPLLQRAQAVQVLNLDRPDDAGASRLELNDLEHWLERQGVQARCQQVSTDEDHGDALLLRAVGHGADLIVMGGFGRPRWAELALGGLTRTVLSTAAVPVLLSH